MDESNRSVFLELGIDFVVEILLFLLPYGAEQMNLPHSFWLGLFCWVAAICLAIRMFWIFPWWSRRLAASRKSLICLVGVGLFVWVFYSPVMDAYHKRNVRNDTRSNEDQKTTQSKTSSNATEIAQEVAKLVPRQHDVEKGLMPEKIGPANGHAVAKKVTPKKTDVSTSGSNSPAVGNVTQGPGSAFSVNQQGGITAATVIVPQEPLPLVTWTQEPLAPGVGANQVVPHTSFGAPDKDEQARTLALSQNPGVMITASPDSSSQGGAFAADCDNPCETVFALAMAGESSFYHGTLEGNRVFVQFITPNPVPRGFKVKWEVRSKSDIKITVKQVELVRIK